MQSLSDNEIGDEGAKSLGPHLAQLTSLQHLNLGSNAISAEGAESLGPHLAQLMSLQHLDLGSMAWSWHARMSLKKLKARSSDLTEWCVSVYYYMMFIAGLLLFGRQGQYLLAAMSLKRWLGHRLRDR